MNEFKSLGADLSAIKTSLNTNNEMTKEIHKAIYGNGGHGLLTNVALNRQAIKRAWWWLGGVSLSILGIAGCIVKKIFI